MAAAVRAGRRALAYYRCGFDALANAVQAIKGAGGHGVTSLPVEELLMAAGGRGQSQRRSQSANAVLAVLRTACGRGLEAHADTRYVDVLRRVRHLENDSWVLG